LIFAENQKEKDRLRLVMQLVNTIVQGILLGGLYALFGTGLSLIFGVMRLVNLAHGDFIVLAAYLSLMAMAFGLHPLLTLLIVIPIMFILGVVLQRGILNKVLGEGLMPPLVITFGMSILVQNVLQLGFSADSQDLDAGALETASMKFSEVTIGTFPLITFITA